MTLDTPLERLFEKPGLPRFDLPAALAAAYGGALGFETPRVIANFVTSVDGVVALPDSGESGHVISGGSSADQFVMGLLRACADTVMVGAGTFRKASGHVWDAETIFPPAAALFAELRARRGLTPRPRFVVVTASGAIDPSERALRGGLIVTTPAGERALRGRAPPETRVVSLPSDTLRLTDVLSLLRDDGARLVLTEGGPSLFTELVRYRLLDELFVTTSPSLFGRFANDHRKSLGDGIDLAGTPLELISVSRQESYLFLRYGLNAPRS